MSNMLSDSFGNKLLLCCAVGHSKYLKTLDICQLTVGSAYPLTS